MEVSCGLVADELVVQFHRPLLWLSHLSLQILDTPGASTCSFLPEGLF